MASATSTCSRRARPPPGSTLDVYNASKQPGAAKVSKHMILFQPSGGQMTVNETYSWTNYGKTAWFDPAAGALRFYLPAAANGNVEVNATAPDGMAAWASAPADQRPPRRMFMARISRSSRARRVSTSTYTVPYTEGAPYAGKIVSKDENTYLVVPNGVSLAGRQAERPGPGAAHAGPHLRAAGDAYKVQLTGAPRQPPRRMPPRTAADDQPDSGPRIEAVMPHVYGQATLILGLALGILALGFVLLYRARPAGPNGERMSAVAVEGVWKFYGDFPALRDVRLEAGAGSCLALIGRNGAGKTTLLRIMAGFSRPGRGQVRIFGEPPRETETRRRMGFIGHGIAVYDELSALET